VLSARIVPDHGGETEFTSTRQAWSRLPRAMQLRLRDAIVTHAYANSRDRIDPGLMTPAERAVVPPVRWRMTWSNPVNNRTALYIASHETARPCIVVIHGRMTRRARWFARPSLQSMPTV
jgi:alpha-ketoglutarate-dependent 2,4-dichlorophenoxyacetate dioxygenase